MARQSGAKQRVGAVRNLRGPLLTTKVYEPRCGWRRLPLSTIDGYMQVALAAGCDWEPPTFELATTSADETAADETWRRLNLPVDGPVAVFNTGGAFGAAKDWPGEYLADLARRLVQQQNMSVLINCGPAERLAAKKIVEQAANSRVVSMADEPELPIGLTKAVVRRSSLLVSTDSGPRFFGIAFGVPVVTLFGPTSTRLTRTYSPLEISVSLDLDCQPCMKRTCPLKHHKCMRDLSVDRVYAAALVAMQRSRRLVIAA
jgi:heptosyltransferase-2